MIGRFLLLDFGHPMGKNTVGDVVKSLQNILALSLVYQRNEGDTYLGISVLNSDFTLIQRSSCLERNYHIVTKNLNGLNKAVNVNNRVTVQEYKYLLVVSIERILHQVQFKSSKNNDGVTDVEIYMVVVTKKTASLLAEILTNVTTKLSKDKNLPLMKKIKVVQILSEEGEKNQGTLQKNNCFIEWITCADNNHDLDCLFKDWLLNLDCDKEQVGIILSKEIDLVVKCDVEDCVIDAAPLPPGGNFLFCAHNRFKASEKTLDVINRIPVSGLCPTLVFGIPRRVHATCSCTLSWVEKQTNYQIFKQLCKELLQTGQGLLVQTSVPTQRNKITPYYFITSDGYMLLMNDIASAELFLPKRTPQLKPDHTSDEDAASVVKSSLQKVQFLEEYTPENFSFGFYNLLRNYLIKTAESRTIIRPNDLSSKLLGGGHSQKRNIKDTNNTCETGAERKTTDESGQQKKKQKLKPIAEVKNVHPALLSPDIVGKFRKYPSAFNLPELREDFSEDLI